MTEQLPDIPVPSKGSADSAGPADSAGSSEPKKAEAPKAAARPARPEYGEYATPQEQAKAIARSLPKPTLATPARPADAAAAADPTAQRADAHERNPGQALFGRAQRTQHPSSNGAQRPSGKGLTTARGAAKNAGQRDAAARPASAANRLATTVLLALGLVYVLGGFPSYLELTQTLDLAYAQWGIGSYAATNLTAGIGIAIMVTQALIWLASAYLAFRRLRQDRSSWWIPLIGAILALIASTALMATLLLADPAFSTFLTTQ